VTKAITVEPPLTGPGSRVTAPPLALTALQALTMSSAEIAMWP